MSEHLSSTETLNLPFEDSIESAFLQFHRENPEVYNLLVKFAREARNGRRKRYSIDAIVHRVRWHYDIEINRIDEFKINNNFTSRYARLIMQQEKDLAGFFEVRILRS
jgi:hypothetical protein